MIFISRIALLLSLVLPTFLNAMEIGQNINLPQTGPKMIAFRLAEQAKASTTTATTLNIGPKPHPQVENEKLFGATVKEMDEVYEDAPVKVKRFARHIKNPNLLRQPHNRIVVLNGPPGTGKSTMIKALAYKTNTLLDFIHVGEIQGESRNQTGKNLHNRLHETLKWVKHFNCPTIICIDELNKIMENSEDSHHDTGFTSTTLWNFLDGLNGEPLYFAATMNQTYKLPKPMKSRISAYTVEVDFPEMAKRIKILKNKVLIDDYITLDKECDDAYLTCLLKATEGFSGRDYRGLADEAVGQFVDETTEDPKQIVLQKKHFNKAVEEIMEARLKSKYYRVEETTEEQHERQFMQGQHAALKIQEKQKGQTTVGIPGIASRTTNGGMNRSDVKDVMEECYSQEQLQLLKDVHHRDSVLMPNWREWLGLTKKV